MKNLKAKINIKTLIIVLIFLLPFLDIYKSTIGNRIEILGISLVEIMNFAYTFILLVLMVILKKTNKEPIGNWKFIVLSGVIIFLYLIGHIINISFFNEELINNANINFIIELYFIIKSYILPIILLFTFYKINIPSKQLLKILSYMCVFISCVIIFTNIFKVSYLAYGSDYGNEQTIEGNIFEWGKILEICKDVNLYTSKGWFYSANQMSAILSGLTLISSLFALKENKFIYYLYLLCDCIALLMLSTKTALIAIFLSIFLVFAYSLYRYIITKQNILKAKSIFSGCAITIIMISLYMNSPIKYKLFGYIENLTDDRSSVIVAVEDMEQPLEIINESEEGINQSNTNNDEKEKLMDFLEQSSSSFGIPKEYIQLYPVNKNIDFWYELIQKPSSEVSNYRTVKYLIYQDVLKKNNNNWDKIFGIGYTSNFPELERDIINQNILYGYVGTIIFVMPFFVILGYCLIKILIKLKKNIEVENYALFIAAAYIMMVSLYSGHVFGMFIPSAFLAVILGSLLSNITENKKEINKKKITFLLLHLGYGGIETATINTANALSEKYNVELACFYKLRDNQENLLNKNIPIKYLYNGGPNKAEFKQAIKEKNIFNILKQGFKALDILVKKRYLIKKEIQNSDSLAIVSTRYDFSVILNKYGRKDIIKIAQEHHHHNNNKKYIKVLKNKYKKIDYLFALTNSLKKDYKKFLAKNKHTKIVLVPNMLSPQKNEQSKVDKTNIVTISRLHEGKRVNELIDIFSKLNNKDAKLYIIGAGDEMEKLKKQINNLGLENRVIMTGYLNKQEQLEYLLNSSIYAMTSVSEGLPMVLLEVMQLGIPCIAYETDSGVTDIIKNNENGFIIKNRDEKKYIEKLNTVLKNYELRKSMSNNCFKTCEKFKQENVSKIWFKILEK